MGDIPAVRESGYKEREREREREVGSGRCTKQDDYVKNRIWRRQRVEVPPHPAVNTHVDQRNTYLAEDSSSYFVFKSKSSA